MEKKFQITDDIACAETLPAEVYVDPVWYERAKEKIFTNSWQFIGEAAQVKTAGHVRPFTLLEGCLDLSRRAHCAAGRIAHRARKRSALARKLIRALKF